MQTVSWHLTNRKVYIMRDHSDDWLREESDESVRIGQLEDRVTELELLVEKIQSHLTQRAPDACPVCLGSGVRVTKITGVQTKSRGVIKCASCNGTGRRR
jgi:hypothetical protein